MEQEITLSETIVKELNELEKATSKIEDLENTIAEENAKKEAIH